MNYEGFTYSTEELAGQLTEQSHQTLYWLNRNGYIDNDATEDLLSRMVVVPIRNRKSFGQRLLDRFFNKEAEDNSYVFPITLLEDVERYPNNGNSTNEKTNLKVVK